MAAEAETAAHMAEAAEAAETTGTVETAAHMAEAAVAVPLPIQVEVTEVPMGVTEALQKALEETENWPLFLIKEFFHQFRAPHFLLPNPEQAG